MFSKPYQLLALLTTVDMGLIWSVYAASLAEYSNRPQWGLTTTRDSKKINSRDGPP